MSFLWLAPTAVLVLGAVLGARLTADLRREAEALEIDLAEAAEAFAVVGDFRTDLDDASTRIEALLGSFGSPLRAGAQTRRTIRHWWSRARHSAPRAHVASRP